MTLFLALMRFVFTILPVLYPYTCGHALQKNDKGQLRLSHRALLPDSGPDNQNVKQEAEKSAEQNTEQPKDKTYTPKVTASHKRSSEDDSLLPSKKFTRKLVNRTQDKTSANKDKTKKNSKEEVGSVSIKDESSLVGEA